MPTLSIIIVSYNTKRLLYDCIESIRRNVKNVSYEVIVVDNGSTDGSVEEIKNLKFKIKNLKTIFNSKNLGFARANNQGMKTAKGRFLLLLNSDTIISNDSISHMIEFMKTKTDAGVVGGKLVNLDGTAQSSTGPFLGLWETMLWLIGLERMGFLRSSPDAVTETDWVSGAFFMVRREVLEKVGYFDEHFFMYLEEMEWCYRIKKNGFSIYFYPSAKVKHMGLGSGDRSGAILNIYKGLPYFYKKHTNYVQYTIVKLLLVAKACIAIAIGIFTKNNYLISTYRKALALVL